MGKIPAAEAARLFEEILGWPYKLGASGTSAAGGVDCSGAWVRVYRVFRKSIAHGSNSQFRRHCSRTGAINGNPGALRVGMAVFKRRPWRDMDKNHSQYGQSPGDLYHVGCVTGANPLRIVHATGPVAKADSALGTKIPGAWTHWGMLSEVEYAEDGGRRDTAPGDGTEGDEIPARAMEGMATVTAGRGSAVKMRAKPSAGERLWWNVPVGAVVPVYGARDGWANISHGGRTGYMMSRFLEVRV